MQDCGTLSAADVIRFVNNSGYGDVLSPRTLKTDRENSGNRFHDRRVYSLPGYIGWLHEQHREQLKNTSSAQYETHKQRMAERSRLKSLATREIGDIPEPMHVEEMEACRYSLEQFCLTFLPGWFPKPFCAQHRQVIGEIEKIVIDGGLQALALPRHRGKTTITKAACLWAVLYGHRRYVVWLAADESKATDATNGFWLTLRTNEKIVEAFPKICYPLVKAGPDQRSRPLYRGRELNMGRRENKIILPDIEDSDGASGILEAGGLLTAVRGLTYDRPDGTIARPDLAVLDDPQTDESAASDPQCEKREAIINQAVLGLSGPGVSIAAVMPCTIIRHGDLSSRILNRKLNPEWHGIIGKALESLPLRMDLWDRYNAIRVECLNEFHDIHLATDFYRQHRDEMDRGVVATWPEDFEAAEISAVQHEMNEYFRDREYFFAERQNCPLQAWDAVQQLSRENLIERFNNLPRLIVPANTSTMTAFIDVHKDVLYWMVVAWRQDFAGQIVAYGTWPDQESSYFDQRNVDFKMSAEEGFNQKSLDTQLELAFEAVLKELDREWKSDNGETFRLRLALIDANWHESTTVVHKFAAFSSWRGKIFPSHGRSIAAGQKPIRAWKREKKDVFGPDWMIPIDRGDHPWRHVVFDANAWKTSCAEFLMADPDGATAVVLHKPEQQFDHRLIVDHFVSEKREPKVGPYRTADVWTLPTNRPDNHWWDCLVGNAVAASICGIRVPQLKAAKAAPAKKKVKRERVHYGTWE